MEGLQNINPEDDVLSDGTCAEEINAWSVNARQNDAPLNWALNTSTEKKYSYKPPSN